MQIVKNTIKNKIQGDGEFEDNKFPPNADSVLGIKDVSYPDANTDIRGKALSAIKVKEGDIECKHTKEIWDNDSKNFWR